MKGLLPGLVFWWLCACLLQGEVLRVATYNVRNYLDVDRWVDGRYRMGFPKPEEEKQALRRVLLSVRPDVLVVQEMGPGPYLNELQSDLRVGGLDLPYLYLVDGPDQDRHIALLSRLEPVHVSTHTDLEFDYFDERIPVKRGMLEAVFRTQGRQWKVFGLHLKSKWSDYEDDPTSDNRRRSETLACRKRILELQKEDQLPFLIMGDLNDTKGTPAVRLLQRRGNREIAKAVDCLDSRGHRWTHYYRKEDEYRRVDYIMKSPDFPAKLEDGVGFIYDGPEALLASDHRLVWIDLEWEELP